MASSNEDDVSRTSRTKKDSVKKKGLVSPASSFVDFAVLETEIYTPELRARAHLYNPHKERQLKKPITDRETVVHLLKGCVGAGMLAMPIAFSRIGVVTGIFATLLLCVLCIYGLQTLLKTQYIQCQRLHAPFLTLPRSLRIALLNGPKPLQSIACIAPAYVDFFLVTYQLGICTAYIIFMAGTLKSIVESQVENKMHLRVYICIIFIPVTLINLIRDLKKLTPVSLMANILAFISIAIIFYYIFGIGPFRFDEVNLVSSVTTWPLFLGTVLFAMEAVGVVIALEHNMENPDHFLGPKGILTWCLIVISTLYMLIGLVGYLKYGKETKDTIIACLPKDEWLSLAAEGIYGFCIFGTYPLQCFVSLEILWGNYIQHHIEDPQKELILEYVLRLLVVSITFVAALVVPHVDLMISLVGAVCLSTLGIVIPFLMELCTLWPDEFGCYCWIFIKDVFFIMLGFLILIVGAYCSIYNIIE